MKVLLLSFLVSAYAYAQTTETTTATFETVVEDVIFNTSSRTVIDQKTIQQSKAPNVISLIESQANITVTNSPYQPSSIYIRGGDASQVLILLDGVPFYDASTVQRTFNLNSLDLKSIKKIEIMKGSQSVLYGGQALSGVIKIDTIPQDMKSATEGQIQVDTENLKDLSLGRLQQIKDTEQAVIVRGRVLTRDVPSPVLDSKETYPRKLGQGEAIYVWKGLYPGHVKLSYVEDKTKSANSGQPIYDIYDVDDFNQTRKQIGATAFLQNKQASWNPRLTLGAQNSMREFDFPSASGFNEKYGSNIHSVRLDMRPLDLNQFKLDVGLQYLYEDFNLRDKNVETVNVFTEHRGVFTKAEFDLDENIHLVAGVRAETWGDRDAVSTWQAGLSLYENSKFEVATGYKTPSLFQLYSRYGSATLREEKTTQYSFTQDVTFVTDHKFSATLFFAQTSDLIVAVGSGMNSKNTNLSKAETRGVELLYTVNLTPTSFMSFNYGYQEPRDVDGARWLVRRPLVTGSVKYNQTWEDIHNFNLEILGRGERIDKRSATGYTSLPGYMIVNAAYSYAFKPEWTGFVRLNNIANTRYQEVYSFYSEGFSGSVGLSFSL